MRLRVYCVTTDPKNFVTAKQSPFLILVNAQKAVNCSVTRTQCQNWPDNNKGLVQYSWQFPHKTKKQHLINLIFLTRKQLKAEPVKKLYGCLQEVSFNYDLGSHEESIIRDVFIAKMQVREIQRELLKTRTPNRALELAINLEMGLQKQLKILGTSAFTDTCSNAYPAVKIFETRGTTFVHVHVDSIPLAVTNCGNTWYLVHYQNWPARGKACKNSAINNRFAKICWKPKKL